MDDLAFAWKWFEHHSKQRMTTIQISVPLLAFLSAGLPIFSDQGDFWQIAIASVSTFFAALIFWGLDKRNRQLIRVAEEQLRNGKTDDATEGENHIAEKIVSRSHASATEFAGLRMSFNFLLTAFYIAIAGLSLLSLFLNLLGQDQ